MTVELTGFVIDATDPVAVSAFWRRVLGGDMRMTDSGTLLTGETFPDLLFRPQTGPKTVKNRVHFDIYVNAVEPLLELGNPLAEYPPERVTRADPEGNEFCAFVNSASGERARLFAVCVDSDRPEELAQWWADQLGARVGPGPDGTPRWLYGAAGAPEGSGSSSASMTRGSARTGGNGGSGERPWLTEPLQGDGATLRATNSAWR